MNLKLGVNIDHVATLREVRKSLYPNLVHAMKEVIRGGADGITIHLREDRRHIQTEDLINLSKEKIHLNLEIAPQSDGLELALKYQPFECCIVPEKREELTTEGGLDVINQFGNIKSTTSMLQKKGIQVSLFIDPEKSIIEAAKETGAEMIEIHTGDYANATSEALEKIELEKIKKAAKFAHSIGLKVNAGHGLTLSNVAEIAKIPEIVWLNIGHSIVSDSLFIGLKSAVREMKQKINHSRNSGC